MAIKTVVGEAQQVQVDLIEMGARLQLLQEKPR